jgi:hypothetical protein
LTARRCPKATFLAFWTGFWRNGYRDLDFAFFGDNPDLYRSSAFDNWRLSSADSRRSLPFTGSEFVAFSTWRKAFLLASRSDIYLQEHQWAKVNRRRKAELGSENVAARKAGLVLTVKRRDALIRQLDTAIELSFTGRDVLSIHLIAMSAHHAYVI